jgi:hypothetical protein
MARRGGRHPNIAVFATLEKFSLPMVGLGADNADTTTTVLQDLYEAVVFLFGKPRARAIWASIPKAKPGRPSGTTRPAGDARLRRIYDACCMVVPDHEVKTLPRRMAVHLTRKYPHEFPIEAASLEQRIRRLLKARERHR